MLKEGEDKETIAAVKGDKVTFEVPSLVRRNDTIYKITDLKNN